MRGASVSGVNAAAFEAVTLTGMQKLGEQFGFSTAEVAKMCDKFMNDFRNLTSALEADLPVHAMPMAAMASGTSVAAAGTPPIISDRGIA